MATDTAPAAATAPTRMPRAHRSNLRRSPAAGEDYRELMTRFPTGVAVVAGVDQHGNPQGMTCTSLASVTLRPPTLSVCLRIDSITLRAVRDRGLFSVNLLDSRCPDTALRFGSPGPAAFSSTEWLRSPLGMPWLVADAFASADCEVVGDVEVGDHSIVLGAVLGIRRGDGHPLLYGLRRFAAWSDNALVLEEQL